jgi:hypothetical protein
MFECNESSFSFHYNRSSHDNTMTMFDTDSSFWICDNGATGHICNNKSLFYCNLLPLIYEVSTANGVDSPSLMGTVILCITDDNGVEHEFELTHINYLLHSLMNYLSLHWSAEQYPNENGNPDQYGTGINSAYDSHTLYWNKKQFCKIFHTANSGLPEYLFMSGYTKLSALASHLAQYYSNTVHWAFSSKVKDIELSTSDEGDIVVTVDSEGGISFFMPDSIDNIFSFMEGMKL